MKFCKNKKNARKTLKKHYLMFVAICAIASFIGTEFVNSMSIIRLNIDDINLLNKEEHEEVINEQNKKIMGKPTKKDEILGRSNGVFAELVNSFTSGSYLNKIINATTSIIGSRNIAVIILILISLILLFLINFFVVNTYKVISRRLFLEGKIYEKIPIQRFTFLLRIKKWTKASCTMFLTSLFQFLWNLTIVGGIIKRYSYYLLPYIVAENPDIPPLEAITLSRNMMNGHKFECFMLELSFVGWYILGLFTFKLTEIFYSNPYKIATFTDYYENIRSISIKNKVFGVEYLNDQYLYEKADIKLLEETYKDIIELSSESKEIPKQKGLNGILSDYLGIASYDEKKELEYELEEVRKIKISQFKDAIYGLSYPTRLYKIPEKNKRKTVEVVKYMRRYSVRSLIIMFFIFAFIGWMWEISLQLIKHARLVNRGVLHGPWLPIYGAGCILILTVLYKLRKNPALSFLFTIIICGVVEYFTSYYLETVYNGLKWWDYSGYFLNLNGRICAEGLLVFGLGGMAVSYIVAPLIDNFIRKIDKKILIPICIILVSMFLLDQVYSSFYPNTGKGVTYGYIVSLFSYIQG